MNFKDFSSDFLRYWELNGFLFSWIDLNFCHNNEHLLNFLRPLDTVHFTSPVSEKVKNERQWSRALLRATLQEAFPEQFINAEICQSAGAKPMLQKLGSEQYAKASFDGLASPPDFNISHSGQQVFLGLSTNGRAIGVDVETGLTHLSRCKTLSRKVLSPNEKIVFQSLPTSVEQIWYFNRIWTAKEAFLKCTGQGISIDLCGLDVLGESWSSFDTHTVKSSKSNIGIGEGYEFVWFKKVFSENELAVCFESAR